jgi:glycosyltransferase involved in cell wall biosynthesis
VPEHVAARITLDERKLSEEELARTVADADFAVLPYRRILNSGSLLLAFSLGVPAVVPDLPAMRELVADGENGFLYAANKIDALAAALARAAATSTEEREAMRIAARASAERLAWSNLADRLRALFDNAPLEDLAA